MVNIQKAAVIGCGFVGSTIAYTLMQKGLFSEMVLLDANKAKAEGEAMDISHGLPFTHAFMRVNMRILQMRRSLLLRQGQTRNRERRDWILCRKMQRLCGRS